MKEEKLSVISDQSSVEDAGKKAEDYFFRASAEDFKKIPGNSIGYWASRKVFRIFDQYCSIKNIAQPKQGSTIGNNDYFLRLWFELAKPFDVKWKKAVKGGSFRRWNGNKIYLVNWGENGEEIKTTGRATIRNSNHLFCQGIEWSRISSSIPSFRVLDRGYFHESASGIAFPKDKDIENVLGLLNSKLTYYFLRILNPTLTFQSGDISRVPFVSVNCKSQVKKLTLTTQIDWNSYETSWDFTTLPLLHPNYRQSTTETTYQQLRAYWQQTTLEMQYLEEENNHIFIKAYGLQDELTPEVPLNEITLTCNPYYRYKKVVSRQPPAISEKNGGKAATDNCKLITDNSAEGGTDNFPLDNELEEKLLSDTMKEFLSYAVGCMFGRYSLDAPGLILANQGETLEDYFRIVKEKQEHPEGVSNEKVISEKHGGEVATDNCKLITENFLPDADNVIPILDQDWFIDDITSRFHEFLKVTFGEEHFDENLKFITRTIGKDIRKYFLKNFYTDHVKRYKKRPIYWLFASPKGSFNALIYMHRYQSDTASIILNDYLGEFRTKLIARRKHLEQVAISASATKTEKTKALKEIKKLKKTIEELNTYENEILYPLATQKIEIDLDDGVKVNYKKFGKALKKVAGLS